MLRYASESGIYGVVLVAGLVVIIGSKTEASWDVLIKVLATLIVFWATHVYAGVVAHLGDDHADDVSGRTRLALAARDSLNHSWGMLMAGVIPLVVLALGVFKLIRDQYAIWGTLWMAVLVLALLGWLGVASWTGRASRGLFGALATSLFGLALVALKWLVH